MKKGCLTGLVLLLIVAVLVIFAGPELINRAMKLLYPKPYSAIVQREAAEFQLDENLVYAVIKAESGFDEDAQSHADAHGLMQLTGKTFDWIASMNPPENGGTDVFDPSDNIHCGCALLRLLLDQYGSLDVALCAYNAGMGNVSGWLSGGEYSDDGKTLHTIPYPETAAYVRKVRENYRTYEKLYAAEETASQTGD